jgi:soluble lytic murein transglycosylase-like protein
LAVVRLVLIGAVLCWSALAPARDIARWRPYVAEASMRFGVPVDWIERVIDAESRGDPMLGGRPTVSPAGAMGLMQLMPGTWSDMRARLGLGANPHDPRNNILAGTLYMRLLFDRFGCPGLFAAYNAGPARYTAYLMRGRGLPAETRGYLATVAGRKSGQMRSCSYQAIRSSSFPRSGSTAVSRHAASLVSPGKGGKFAD